MRAGSQETCLRRRTETFDEKVVRLRTRMVAPRPFCRAGFSVVVLLFAAATEAADIQGRVLDAASGLAIAGVTLRAWPPDERSPRYDISESNGHFRLAGVAAGLWRIETLSIAYHPAHVEVLVGDSTISVDLRLAMLPLAMDEVVVRASHAERTHTAAFVERLPVEAAGPGADVPRILQQANGVDIRRYGGLGAFSSLSIRGSTSEQVLVFLDGVPLNAALGGSVDLGTLPAGGVESIDVYRGAVPGRFGGNSMGGVVHMRTRPPGGATRLKAQVQAGAFATRQASMSVSGRRRAWDGLVLADYSRSDNDFRFFDDNGTEYNASDDEWVRRRNSDFASGRLLLRAARQLGAGRVQLSHTTDVSHRGLPGIGNHQALHTRLDTRRHISEVNLFGPAASGHAGYRVKTYHSLEQTDYKDLLGEVGVGLKHDRNTTTGIGLRSEANVLAHGMLTTVFSGIRHERFSPTRLLAPEAASPSSRRLTLSAGVESEITTFTDRLVVNIGGQVDRMRDNFFDASAVSSNHGQSLWSSRLGLSLDLGAGWTAQAHGGRYARAPGFFELFGDRGNLHGNLDLRNERGINLDGGLIYRARQDQAGIQLLELAVYENRVDDLIRFIQNSQRVSRPHNVGRAHLRGLETRVQTLLPAGLQLDGGYTWQSAQNRSPFSFEHGNDLPNAPSHRLRLRAEASLRGVTWQYEASRESRHFLDRANLRPVPARTIHTAGIHCGQTTTLAIELRNLTNNQVADLWGYPLPGRALFVSLTHSMESADR